MATKMTKNNSNSKVKENNEEKVVEKKETKKKKVFEPNDYIQCHSATAGGLSIICPSGNYYEFKEYGCDGEIEYKDLVSLIRKRSDHIFLPRIIIDDEDFLEEFRQVKKLYEDMYTGYDLIEVLRLPVDEMLSTIKKMPSGIYPNLRSTVSTMIANGQIDSVRKIRALSDFFGSDFNLISELFSN